MLSGLKASREPCYASPRVVLKPLPPERHAMNIITHQRINPQLCGTPAEVTEGASRVILKATDAMIVDDTGLVHGGFIFGLADHAAMIAVNHPNVVLGAASVKFLKPVALSEEVVAEARVTETSGKKRIVAVQVQRGDTPVFEGVFTCFVLERHVMAG